jgi:hypothetical protein
MYDKWEVQFCLGWGMPLHKAKGALPHIQKKIREWAVQTQQEQGRASSGMSFEEACAYLEGMTDHSGGVFTLRGWNGSWSP